MAGRRAARRPAPWSRQLFQAEWATLFSVRVADGSPVTAGQVQHFIHEVDADEYDRAVAAVPQLGRPFAAALGDHRSGRQLLTEHSADSLPAAATLAGLQSTPAGRQRLSLLAEEARRRFAPVVHAAAALVHALPSRSPSPFAAGGSDTEWPPS